MNLAELQLKYPGCTTFVFGDNRALCDDLIARVRNGMKTATCDALRVFETGDTAMPSVGRIDIALDWDGTPALALRTLAIEIESFSEVGEVFALAEGENDDLQGWRQAHKAYFERNGGFDPAMKLVCERFELVEDFA